MDRTPPDNDEQAEKPSHKPRRASVPPTTTPSQPRYRYQPIDHLEHPEIPKILRASRNLEQTTRHPVTELDEDETTDKDTQTEYRKPAVITKSTPRYRVPEQITSKNTPLVPEKNRAPLYTTPPTTPRPPAIRIRHTRPKRSIQQQLIHLTRSRPGMLLIIGLVLLLLFSVIAFDISRSQSENAVNSIATVTSQNNGTPQTSIQSGNPYELIITPEDTDHPPPPVFATSAYLLDADTGATLYAHNAFMHLPMLSTTKLITALLAVEQGKLDQPITITSAIARDISKLSADSTVFGLKQGETYTLSDMLYGLLLLSGNDVAIAIADTLGGTLPHFVADMNQRAHQLGLNDTHYMNPHGLLDTEHYSSARDLAVLGRYALNNPIIHKISGAETYDIPKTSTHPDHPLLNGNQFLFWYPGVDGGKPGYDGGANFVQVISVTRNHHHLIGVTMHTINWWTDMRDLMNWGFDSFTWISPHDVDSQQNPIPYDYLWNYFASDAKESTIATAGGRYYILTGYSIPNPILSYFDKTGGLKQFGYPVSLPLASGGTAISQHFEKSTIQCDLASKQCTFA